MAGRRNSSEGFDDIWVETGIDAPKLPPPPAAKPRPPIPPPYEPPAPPMIVHTEVGLPPIEGVLPSEEVMVSTPAVEGSDELEEFEDDGPPGEGEPAEGQPRKKRRRRRRGKKKPDEAGAVGTPVAEETSDATEEPAESAESEMDASPAGLNDDGHVTLEDAPGPMDDEDDDEDESEPEEVRTLVDEEIEAE